MTLFEQIYLKLTRRPNPIKPGTNTSFVYRKPIEEWSIEERNNWQSLVVKDPIAGLERRVKETIGTEDKRPSLTEVFKSAQDEVTKIKFE